jgi:hypothetical protein
LVKSDHGFHKVAGRRFVHKEITLRTVGDRKFVLAYIAVTQAVYDDTDVQSSLTDLLLEVLGESEFNTIELHTNYRSNNQDDEDTGFSSQISGFFCILTKEQFALLSQKNTSEIFEFKIASRHVLGSHLFRAKARKLHISLPTELSADCSQMEDLVISVLNNFEYSYLLNSDEYSLDAVKKTHEFDDGSEPVTFWSAIIISFTEDVPLLTIQAIRLILHNREFSVKNSRNRKNQTNVRYIRCTWYDPGSDEHDAQFMIEVDEMIKELNLTDGKKKTISSPEPKIISSALTAVKAGEVSESSEKKSRNARKNKNSKAKKDIFTAAAIEKLIPKNKTVPESVIPTPSPVGSYAAVAAGKTVETVPTVQKEIMPVPKMIQPTAAVAASDMIVLNGPRLVRLGNGSLMALLPDGSLTSVSMM